MNIFENVTIPNKTDLIFIDVGLSSDAPHTISWLTQYPNCFVFGFEPVKENCDRVLEKIKNLNFDNRFHLFHCAVDDVEGEVIKNFYVTCNSEVKGDHGQSSLYKLREEVKQSMWVDRTVPTLCVNLNDLFSIIEHYKFPDVSILKTDTQGNDLTILKSIQRNLHKIKYISCESHTHNAYQKDDDDPTKIYDYLTSNGFEFLTGNIFSPDHVYKRKGVVE